MSELRLPLVGAAVVLLLAACSIGSAAIRAAPPEAELTITASQGAFEDSEITVSSGRLLNVWFRNLDAAPHNVAIYSDVTAEHPIFAGDTITHSAQLLVFPALEPGDYVFRCTVKTDMIGALVVER